MCGITGFIDFNKKSELATLEKMVASLEHRGPDDKGALVFENSNAFVGLGQRRLSIIDITSAGHQPMSYRGIHLVFNGEIYNYQEIKQILVDSGHIFETSTDTEVILHAFCEWGVACIERFIGMFSICLFDEPEDKVYFIRDRAGVKPFFTYRKHGLLMFASELKSFHQHQNFDKTLNLSALYAYFDYGYIPSPHCIFEHAEKVDAGEYIEINLKTQLAKKVKYWDVNTYYAKPNLKLDYSEAKQETKKILISAYNYRMVSDVPVGVFLSGGYDSTSVAAILQSESKIPLKTFTIGFREGNNEAPFAKETAKFLGTDHHEYYCTEKEAKDIIPELPYYYDEPFADSSAIPTILVSRFAKKHVTVALSADAGDEIFAGYSSYPQLDSRIKKLERIPSFLRPVIKKSLKAASNLIPVGKPDLKHKLQGLSKSMSTNNYDLALNIFHQSSKLPEEYRGKFILKKVADLNSDSTSETKIYNSVIEMVMAIDYKMYLPNDILTKVDRATMSTSLEGREPLLDHRIVEFAAQLPLKYKFDGITTKRILKDIVHDYIPEKMLQRPKTGFSIPIYNWLQNDLDFLVEEYLNKEALKESGLFDEDFITRIVEKFKKNDFHYKPFIWKLLMFQMWYKHWMN